MERWFYEATGKNEISKSAGFLSEEFIKCFSICYHVLMKKNLMNMFVATFNNQQDLEISLRLPMLLTILIGIRVA